MYRRIGDFIGDLEGQSAETLKLLRAIPDSAAATALPGARPLGRIAWHLACAIGEIARNASIGAIEPHDDQGQVPPMADIVAAYERAARDFAELVGRVWTDPMLDEEVQVYGRGWRRGDLLSMLLIHEAHHRGQMTVLMRQSGLAVPGVVGPSREEWGAYGMPAQR